MARIDLSSSATSTAAGVQAVITNSAQPGDEIHLAAGTFTWTTFVTNAGKNVSIFGAGPGATTISGPKLFVLTGQLNSNILRLSGMTLTATNAGPQLTLGGVSVVDENTFTGGLRIDHIIFNGNQPSHTVNFGGWVEGVMDHCIMDYDLSLGLKETILVDHPTSPTGTGDYGDYSYSHPYAIGNDVHAFFFEDNLFKRSTGGLDTGGVTPGGARVVTRHNTAWGQIGGGHGSRESGSVRAIGQRVADVSKNLCVRAPTDAGQDGNYFSCRAGEHVYWGNRIKRYGANVGSASTPLQAQNYMIGAQRGGDSYLGPDGTCPWDVNQKGNFTINEPGSPANGIPAVANNGVSFTVDSGYSLGTVVNGIDSGHSGQNGDVYLHGTGGVGAAFSNTLTLTRDDGTPINYVGNGHWNDFVVKNLALQTPVGGASPVPFAYITATATDHLTVFTSNVFGGNPGVNQMTMGPNDKWEIRRVRKYFQGAGYGMMDTSLDSATTGVAGARLVSGTPNPRYPNLLEPGISQWDNKYKVSQAASFAPVANWGVNPLYVHSLVNVRNENVHPGYPYNSTTPAGSPDTRVGADDEVWAMAPPSLTSLYNNGTDMYHSLFETGSGGYTYPHPLVGTIPFISGPGSATVSTSSSGVQTLAKFSAVNIPGTVSWGLFTGSWPSNVSLDVDVTDSSKAVLSTGSSWPSGDTAGDTKVTIRASSGLIHADASFTLTIKTPNQAPTGVTVSSDKSSYVAPAAITLTSAATDSDGSIATMQYYYGNGPTLIATIDATAVASPYKYVWTGVTAATYSITVKATDNQGGATTSDAISVTVTPSLGILPPSIVVRS